MAKTKEELQELKQEYMALTNKLKQLSEEELQEIAGGEMPHINPDEKYVMLSEKPGNLWKDQNLPTDAGSYKLDSDVNLNDNWNLPDDNNKIKL